MRLGLVESVLIVRRNSKNLPAKKLAASCWDICNAVADLTLSIACWQRITDRAPFGPWGMGNAERWWRSRLAMSLLFRLARQSPILRPCRRMASLYAPLAIQAFPLALPTKRSIIDQ